MVDTTNYVTLQEILGIPVDRPITVQGSTVTVPSGYRLTSSKIGITPAQDLSSTTAEASDVLYGKLFYDSQGILTQGTVQSIQSTSYIPATSDQIIPEGYYIKGAQVIKGDVNLTASNIVAGVSIFGITGTHVDSGGTDVTSTTAAPSDVLSGKSFYTSNGVLTQGTIPVVGASTYTPGSANQSISQGVYLNGEQTILGDSNLKPQNIVQGAVIFGVAGNASAGSGLKIGYVNCSGQFQPAAVTGGTVIPYGQASSVSYVDLPFISVQCQSDSQSESESSSKSSSGSSGGTPVFSSAGAWLVETLQGSTSVISHGYFIRNVVVSGNRDLYVYNTGSAQYVSVVSCSPGHGCTVFNAGKVTALTIGLGGSAGIYSGGTASLVGLLPTGSLYVASGGSAVSVFSRGGSVTVDEGGYITYA